MLRSHENAQNSGMIVTDDDVDVARVMQAVVRAALREREDQSATVGFIVPQGKKEEVESALAWMHSSARFKMPPTFVQTLAEVFSMAEQEFPLAGCRSDGDRCAAHPVTALNKFAQPFGCCRYDARGLHTQLTRFAALFVDDPSEDRLSANEEHRAGSDDIPEFDTELGEVFSHARAGSSALGDSLEEDEEPVAIDALAVNIS